MAGPSSGHYNSVLDSDHYDVISQDDNGNVKVKCLLCPPNSKPKSGSIHSTGNFTGHLKRKHETEYNDYMHGKKSKNSHPIEKFLTTTKPKKCNQEECSKMITNLIVKCALPVSLVEKGPFKDLIETVSSGNCHSIARKTLTSRIDKMSADHYDHIKNELKGVDYVCTTADIWSTKNNKRSFIGMTVHYIDPIAFERRSYAIACERFKGSHDQVSIAEKVEQIHNRYYLPTKKIVRTISDNASNFTAAFARFGMSEALTENEGDIIDLQENDMDVSFDHFGGYESVDQLKVMSK